LRNFKKVYRSNKLGRSDFKKFAKKSSKKGSKNKNYDIMRTSRTHQKICYQKFIRSRNLKKLKLIDEQAYLRVKEKVKATSATSSSVAASQKIEQDSFHITNKEIKDISLRRKDSLPGIEIKRVVQIDEFTKFRKLSCCSSTANSYLEGINNEDLANKKSTKNRIKYLQRSPERYSEKQKKLKGSYFSLDKAATPNINNTCPQIFKSTSFDVLEIWQDCNFKLFATESGGKERLKEREEDSGFRLVKYSSIIFKKIEF
jgi:hypothetical protein